MQTYTLEQKYVEEAARSAIAERTDNANDNFFFRGFNRIGPGKRSVNSASLKDRSKYTPHQGLRERARRMKQRLVSE